MLIGAVVWVRGRVSGEAADGRSPSRRCEAKRSAVLFAPQAQMRLRRPAYGQLAGRSRCVCLDFRAVYFGKQHMYAPYEKEA